MERWKAFSDWKRTHVIPAVRHNLKTTEDEDEYEDEHDWELKIFVLVLVVVLVLEN
jgi:hypothetical protein